MSGKITLFLVWFLQKVYVKGLISGKDGGIISGKERGAVMASYVYVLFEEYFTDSLQKMPIPRKYIKGLSQLLSDSGIENEISSPDSLWERIRMRAALALGGLAFTPFDCLCIHMCPDRVYSLLGDYISCTEGNIGFEIFDIRDASE